MIKRHHALIFVLALFVAVIVLTLTGVFSVNLLKMNGSQFTLGAIIFVLSMGIGLVWKAILDYQKSNFEITWAEFLIGGAIVALIFSAVGVNIGWKIALNNKVKYNEYWNGWELTTQKIEVPCTENGSCRPTYDCDSYIVPVTTESCTTDTDGNESCTSTTTMETRWNSCPYVSVEYTYIVSTSLGDYNLGNLCFPDNPSANRFQATRFTPSHFDEADYFNPISQYVMSRVCVGTPPLWVAATKRVTSGDPGPVTQRNSYENYILSSDTTIFKEYSDQIDRLKKAGLLPDLRHDVRDYYQADKVYFVGFNPADPIAWQKAEAYLNAAFGTELQGDLHLVIVQNAEISANPEAYIIALKAYWQSSQYYGKDAISKNSVIVVLGTTDGQTISWARAVTGMPIGNEAMITAIQNHFVGTQLTQEAVLGVVNGQFYQKVKTDGSTKLAVQGVGETGILRQILWGMTDPATKFVRVSMSANDTTDNGTGFTYLKNQIRPDFGQQLVIVIVILLLSCVVWLVDACFIGERRDLSLW